MTPLTPCPHCKTPTNPDVLAEAHHYAFWKRPNGACPACVQHELLTTLETIKKWVLTTIHDLSLTA